MFLKVKVKSESRIFSKNLLVNMISSIFTYFKFCLCIVATIFYKTSMYARVKENYVRKKLLWFDTKFKQCGYFKFLGLYYKQIDGLIKQCQVLLQENKT